MSARLKIPLWIEPLDVLFFRDGRPFSAATRASSGLPTPQTLAGAVWTGLLRQFHCNFQRLAAEVRGGAAWRDAIRRADAPEWIAEVQVRGPWLARSRDRKSLEDVYVAVPGVLQEPKHGGDRLYRLHPLPAATVLPGWQPLRTGMRPLWLRTRDAVEPVRGYLNNQGLRDYLAGKTPSPSGIVPQGALYEYESRTGIGIDFDRLTSEEGQIYLASFLALQRNVGFYTEVLVPETAGPFPSLDTISFGGEGKRAVVHRLERPHQWPGMAPQEAGEKPLWLLTSPGFFAARWCPALADGLLAAASVPGDIAVSGWDLARGGPKRTRFAAAAGSVYFLNALPATLPDVLSETPEDQQQGWGCYVQGVWTDA